MGMHEMREELEDLAFQELNPDAYRVISERLDALELRNVGLVVEIEQQLTRKLGDRGIVAEVSGRRKRAYSIWRKMERKSVGFEQLSDIVGFRVVVKMLPECYQALGIVHTTWPTVPTRFKDYISTPKQNDYQSLHTTVIGPGQQRVELQIRTREMHEIAEYGIAAHALYKDNAGSPTEMLSRESSAYAWLRRTIELLAEGSNPEEFLEHTKLELFHDQVFCFTPKGKLVALPRRANAIDFAYTVHTDVGDQAIGCKINGKIAPLVSELNNGDEVEIITSKAQVAPPAAWESLVITGKARAAIRRATRVAVRSQYAGLGRRIVERTVPSRQARIFRREAAGRAAAACARLHRRRVLRRRPQRDARRRCRPRHVSRLQGGARSIAAPAAEARTEPLVRLQAQQGRQVPGARRRWLGRQRRRGCDPDPRHQRRLAGAVCGRRRGAGRSYRRHFDAGEGITIYPIQSPALQDFEDAPECWIDLRWDTDDRAPQRFPAQIALKTVNEPGSLAQVAQIIAEHDGNIDNIHMERKASDFTSMTIDLEVYDLKHLTSILAQLRAKDVVASAERVNG